MMRSAVAPDTFQRYANSASNSTIQDEEDLEEIDPTAIRSRRTRGVRVDYTSAEALEKAGLKPEDMDKDDD